MIRFPPLLAAFLLPLSALLAHAEQRYRLVPLGLEEVFRQAEVYAINDRGEVVGYGQFAHSEYPLDSGFIWDEERGVRLLGALLGQAGNTFPYGLNERGEVVGYSWTASSYHAFHWSDGRMRDLGFLGSIDPIRFRGISVAEAINNLGQVAGSSPVDHPGQWRAVIWDPDSGPRNLGTLGGPISRAKAINDRGEVVGESVNQDGRPQAFVWTESSGMIGLPGLDPAEQTFAVDINENSLIAGYCGLNGQEWRAALWSPAEGLTLLPDFGRAARALGLNDRNEVVGFAETPEGESRAVLWRGGALVDLSEQTDRPPGWRLQRAVAIRNLRWIIGSGTDPEGRPSVFLLVPEAAPQIAESEDDGLSAETGPEVSSELVQRAER
jgi:probable HAF family extracellular repeat protein